MFQLQNRSIFLILFTVLVLVLVAALTRGSISSCDSAETNIEFDKSVEVNSQNASKEVLVDFGLRKAGGPRTFSLQYFLNGEQIFVGEDTVLLDCGESKEFKHELPLEPDDDASLTVFFRQLPIIPNSYTDKTAEEVLVQPNAASAAYDFTDFETVFINDGYQYDETETSDINYEYIENPEKISFLFAESSLSGQTLVTELEEDVYNFGLYFGESSEDPNEVFTFTCMLNDVQIDAFNGNSTWSGKIPERQGVVVYGSVEVEEEGWHQLRCVSLNSIFADSENINYYPYTILSTYLFKPDAN